MPCDVLAALTMSSTRVAWYPRAASTLDAGVEQLAHGALARGPAAPALGRCAGRARQGWHRRQPRTVTVTELTPMSG